MTDQTADAHRLLCEESDTFLRSVETLRRLVSIAHPEAQSLDDNPQWREAVEKAEAALSPEKRAILRATLTKASPFILAVLSGAVRTSDADDPNTDASDAIESANIEDPIELVPDAMRDDVERARSEMSQTLEEDDVEPDFEFRRAGLYSGIRIKDPEIRVHFDAIIERMQKEATTPSHEAMLIRSILTTAVSAFEVLISNLYRSHVIANPSAAEDPNTKSFSLSDLYSFGSIEDAVAETILQQSDRFSRKGIKAWADWFGGRPLSIDLPSLALDWDRTREVFERRNVVVHNGSRATRQYLRNVAPALHGDLEVGDPLDVTPEYIEEALQRLFTLGMLLSLRVRLKLFGKIAKESTSDWINDAVFEMLIAEEFVAVEHVAGHAVELSLMQAQTSLLIVNRWIAKARLRGLDSIADEVKAWDTSALADNYRMAKHVLLDQPNAVSLIESRLDDGSIGVTELLDWPLFHWLRERRELDDLIASRAEGDDERVVELEPDAAEPSGEDLGSKDDD